MGTCWPPAAALTRQPQPCCSPQHQGALGTLSQPQGQCPTGQGRGFFVLCQEEPCSYTAVLDPAGVQEQQGEGGASPVVPAPIPIPRDSPGRAPGATSPLPSGSTRCFHAWSPHGQEQEGSGRWCRGKVKCEISHLPRGGRRLRGGCQPALSAASLHWHGCQHHERHCLHGPGSCPGLCRPLHQLGSSCIPPPAPWPWLEGGWGRRRRPHAQLLRRCSGDGAPGLCGMTKSRAALRAALCPVPHTLRLVLDFRFLTISQEEAL